MKYNIVLLGLAVLLQCKTYSDQSNKIDYEFKSNFDNCIQIVTMRQIDCRKVDCTAGFWNTTNAFECLYAITSVKSNVFGVGEVSYLYPMEDKNKDFTEYFYEDLIRWNDWYEKNKYSITMEKADSLIMVHSKSIGAQIKWPQSYTMIFSSNPPIVPTFSDP